MSVPTAMLTAPGPFAIEIDGSCNAARWKSWLRKFTTFAKAAGLKADLMLDTFTNLAGEQLDEVTQNVTKDGDVYKTVVEALTKHFAEAKDLVKLVIIFREAKQRTGEDITSRACERSQRTANSPRSTTSCC